MDMAELEGDTKIETANGASLTLTLINSEIFLLDPLPVSIITPNGFVAQIQDAGGRFLLSVLVESPLPTGTGQPTYGPVTRFVDSAGRSVMTAHKSGGGRPITVSSGDRLVGIVEGIGCCFSKATVRDTRGTVIFNVVKGNGGYSYSFIAQESRIASIHPDPQNRPMLYEISCRAGTDVSTKALILSTAYLLHSSLLTSKCGCGSRRRLALFIAIPAIATIVIVIVVVVVVCTLSS